MSWVFWFHIYIFFAVSICADLRGTAPKPLIPASPTSGHTQGSFCIVAPPLEVHRKWCQIVGGLPSEGDCYRVTLAVFSTACSDWTYAGHHLLCPLLMTMLAKSWSQIEWASPPETRHPQQSSYVDSDIEGFDWTASGKGGGRNTKTEATTKAWHDGQHFLFFYLCSANEDDDDNWWCYGGPFQFETTEQGCRPRLLSKLSWG